MFFISLNITTKRCNSTLNSGNDWLPLNKVYVDCFKHGNTQICPATIFAHMSKWSAVEIVRVMLDVIDKSLIHLQSIEEI